MFLNQVPPKASFLMTSTGLTLGPKSIYNTPLSLRSEFFKIKTAAFYQHL